MATKPIRKRFEVPVYNCTVYVCLAEDLNAEHERMAIFPSMAGQKYSALLAYTDDGRFGLFLPHKPTHETIAHELFHLTHRIAEWAGVPFHTENHEAFAHIQGYVAQKVYEIVED